MTPEELPSQAHKAPDRLQKPGNEGENDGEEDLFTWHTYS
jgi:hypothetical protein